MWVPIFDRQFNLTLGHRRVGRVVLGPPPSPILVCGFTMTSRTECRALPVPQLPRTAIGSESGLILQVALFCFTVLMISPSFTRVFKICPGWTSWAWRMISPVAATVVIE